ncbi:MAG: hypothetical protein IJB27_01505 [Clostridia bacterium]|nr:hypothetical protein [Clostridia bacterium]
MKTYTICGSMRFQKEMQDIAYALEAEKGYAVLQCVYCSDDTVLTDAALARLAEAHYKKIDLSDGIYVVNIDGYIGESVHKEIEYAKANGKDVLYYCETKE